MGREVETRNNEQQQSPNLSIEEDFEEDPGLMETHLIRRYLDRGGVLHIRRTLDQYYYDLQDDNETSGLVSNYLHAHEKVSPRSQATHSFDGGPVVAVGVTRC